jgi:hypothetical protein
MIRRRLTAQLVISERELVLAYSCFRLEPGPNGEFHVARLFRTADGGARWSPVSLVRTWFNRLRYWGFPVWPPEAVSSLAVCGQGIEMLFRDEWVPFEPGGESLWRAQLTASGHWRVSRIRLMRYETDEPAIPVPEIALDLPTSVMPPPEDLLDASWE